MNIGTRGVVGFVSDNKVWATYNHYDSYPTGLGADVATFLRESNLDTAWSEVTRSIKEAVAALTIVDSGERPTAAQIDDLRKRGMRPGNVSTGADWYAWLRDCQGDLSAYLRAGYWPDGLSFAQDSLFCEWGYLVNLDNQTVEVFRGFNKEGRTEGRFGQADPKVRKSLGETYGPIYLIEAPSFEVAASDEHWSALEDRIYSEEED